MCSSDLAGTADDGQVISVKLLLNGKLLEEKGANQLGDGTVDFKIGRLTPAGEYKLEAVAEDSNGLVSRVERMVSLVVPFPKTITLTSPTAGEVLQKGRTHNFVFTGSPTALLEINGQVRWSGELTFLNNGRLPADGSKKIGRAHV